MEDRYSSEFINNFLKRFDVEASAPPKDVVEPAGGDTGPEDAAQSAEKTQPSKEKWTARTAAAKERVKSAGLKTRDVNQGITNKIKELASKDPGGELKPFIKDKITDARDKMNGAKNYFTKEDNLLKNVDGITEKAVNNKNSLLERTSEATKGVLHRATEKLVTKPQETTKSFGVDVGKYFMNQGKNVVNGLSADAYGFKADVNQSIADKYSAKATRQARSEGVQVDGKGHNASRLEKKYQRIAERKGRTEAKHEQYTARASRAREAAKDFRADIAGR